MLRLSISKFTAFDGCTPRELAMLELLQGHAHMRGSIRWVLQTSVKGPGLPSDLSRNKKLRVPGAKFLRKIQFPRSLSRSLNHKFAAGTFLGKRITAHDRPVFATQRNTGKFAAATRSIVAVNSYPRFCLVCLRDWCITAKFIADRNAFRRSDSDAFFVRVLVLPDPVKVEAKDRMK